MGKCKHPDCVYRDPRDKCCLYILIEGHSRPCPPGVCTGVYRPGERRRTKFGAPVYEAEEALTSEDQLFDLYFQGWADHQIAKHFGVSRLTIWRWRRKNDLPSVTPNKESEDEEWI